MTSTDRTLAASHAPGARRRAIFFDVENASRATHIAAMLEHLGLPDGGNSHVSAIGNWRVVSVETSHLLSRAGATLIHSAPVVGVKDWSDLRIAVDAGRWLGDARAGDVLEIISDDQAFDAVGDLAATRGVAFRRLSLRALAQRGDGNPPCPSSHNGHRSRGRSRRNRSR
jgi:hypothetical protein